MKDHRHTLITAVCAIASVAAIYSLLLASHTPYDDLIEPGGIILFIDDLP
jgi:hypothetical protein